MGWVHVSAYNSGHFTKPSRVSGFRNRTLLSATIRGLDRPPETAKRMTSWPILTIILGIFIVLSVGPLQNLDRALAQDWSEWIIPKLGPVLADVIDPIASQPVAVPILGLVAVVLAWRTWSLRPIISGALTEFAVVGLGGMMKLFFGRPAPVLSDPAFFHAGVLAHGWRGVSFPSGHLIEAVALYGVAVLLIARYTSVSRRAIRMLSAVPIFVTVVTCLQSFYMQWHWATDLVGGLLVGVIILRAVMDFDTALQNTARIGPLPLEIPIRLRLRMQKGQGPRASQLRHRQQPADDRVGQ